MPKSCVVGPVNSFFNLLTPSQYFWRAVAFFKMFGRVTLMDSPAFYLDLLLVARRLGLDFFFKAAFVDFVVTMPDIFMPPIGPRLPPAECEAWPPMFMASVEPDRCFFFSKSSGKLSIKALTSSTAESKL